MATMVNEAEAQQRFIEIVSQVSETGEPVTIEREGLPLVIVVPAEPNRFHLAARPTLREWLDEADRIGQRIREQLGDRPLPDLGELIDGGRDERDERIVAGLR